MAKSDVSIVGDGIQIDLNKMWSVCELCHDLKPMRQFGMRQHAKSKVIERQPRCKPCRKV